MVPGIGPHGLRAYLAPHLFGEPIGPLLQRDAHNGCYEGYHSRRLQLLTVDDSPRLGQAVVADHGTHAHQGNANEGGGQRLVFAMPIVVILVLRLVAELDEQQHHNVSHEVGQRVHGISYHGSRPAQDSGGELQCQQQRIDDAASNGDTVYGLFSLTVGIGFFHQFFEIKGLLLQI